VESAPGFPSVKLAWADGGYAGKLVTWAAGKLKPKLTLEIVKRPDDLHTFQVLPRRWVVERTLAWITRHRRSLSVMAIRCGLVIVTCPLRL
jgi:transposase